MAKRVAFCLVEDKAGRVLLVQRGYGKEKYQWSLPGGHVDHKESSWRAAVRETREETGHGGPSGQGATNLDIYRNKRPGGVAEPLGRNSIQWAQSVTSDVDTKLEGLLGAVWQDPSDDSCD